MQQDKLYYACIATTLETLGGGFKTIEEAITFKEKINGNIDYIQEMMPDTLYTGEKLSITCLHQKEWDMSFKNSSDYAGETCPNCGKELQAISCKGNSSCPFCEATNILPCAQCISYNNYPLVCDWGKEYGCTPFPKEETL